jgi:hypothetical protein
MKTVIRIVSAGCAVQAVEVGDASWSASARRAESLANAPKFEEIDEEVKQYGRETGLAAGDHADEDVAGLRDAE